MSMSHNRLVIRLSSVAVASLLVLAASAPSDAWARGGGGGHSGGSHSGQSTSSGHVNPSSHSTQGYYRQGGTYVPGYHATNPNGTRLDNYSTKGNVNPWTGKSGTHGANND